jgi:hypothetical protein
VVAALRLALLAAVLAGAALAQKFYTYVGTLSSHSVTLAWGTTDGVNTIGRSSPSHGDAIVRIAGRTLSSTQNWVVVDDLKPDTSYPYKVVLNDRTIGQGTVQTWAELDSRLVFFVLGDYGTGTRTEYGIAQAMWNEFLRRNNSGNPVRFVITVGDNIYGDINTFFFGIKNTGAEDRDWARKFFEPYQQILGRIPFYPTLGNHDGNETENRADLSAYLDNFFFPGEKPSRWYQFSYAGLADFFALDSTMNTESGPPLAQYLAGQPQFKWMQQVIPASKAPWKIPYFHHPPFNAGPRHPASYRDLQHWVELFANSGVKVSFHGHEHNFQISEANRLSGGIRFVVAGSGGELRTPDVTRKMANANIAAFTAQNEFLEVEIDGKTMRITPLGYEPMRVHDANGAVVRLPFVITLP